jgi:hypothetical protein
MKTMLFIAIVAISAIAHAQNNQPLEKLQFLQRMEQEYHVKFLGESSTVDGKTNKWFLEPMLMVFLSLCFVWSTPRLTNGWTLIGPRWRKPGPFVITWTSRSHIKNRGAIKVKAKSDNAAVAAEIAQLKRGEFLGNQPLV